jgi:adenosylcobinamide-GDP ribazoletransferase
MSLPTDLARAVAFLSRLPVPSRFFEGDDGRLSRTVRAFPLAGIVLSLPAALLLSLLAWIEAPPLLAAGLAVALQAGVTGALHEDGLADTADGLGAGADRQRALDIMKDSRIGVFGVVALLMALLLRVAALAALIPVLSPAGLFLVVLAAAAASRAAMVWHWKSLPPARPDGVAASAGRPETHAAWTALASGLGFALVALWLAAGLGPALAALLALVAAYWLFSVRTGHRLGGATGDTIGATQQVVELAILVTLATLL